MTASGSTACRVRAELALLRSVRILLIAQR
jgi:hypothetical protein